MILEAREWWNGVELTIFGPRGGVRGIILLDKDEFRRALITMYEQLEEIPF